MIAVGFLGFAILAGCASTVRAPGPAAAPRAVAAASEDAKPIATTDDKATEPADDRPTSNGPWIGAAAESEMMLAAGSESFVGIWVDAPGAKPHTRPHVDLALVIDTSGSMQGEKIENARTAAKQLVAGLADGDVVSVDTFSDRARSLVPPTIVNGATRVNIQSRIAELGTGGSTNMFDGLSLAEQHAAEAPASHSVRRVVMLSDGQANVGPSSPDALGMLAERGLRFRTQVTSLGVGNDYDENTLNAIAVRTSGRLFHLNDPREMASILKHEVDLLGATVASDAYVEIVPAPGVEITGTDGARPEWGSNGVLKLPLGTLFAGQHREALLRVRVPGGATGVQRTIASVRLHFHDPSEGDLDRVQEIVARVQTTDDAGAIASHVNAKTKSIVAIFDAAKVQIQAAQQINNGQFAAADQQLAQAETQLKIEAARAKDGVEKKRLDKAAQSIAHARAAASAAPAAPPAARRNDVLQMNSDAMHDLGY
jgi:Ca-activated chloride channel family protein